ncbi:MAG: alkaline phosphatase family protein [Proteobacteria bacterium]|nr:alkaline phosphatase family protein [Pseudomonadota bacterium]
MVNHRTKLSAFVTATLTTCALLSAAVSTAHERDSGRKRQIKHVVIIFQENASFDHYFATYPDAKNTDGVHFRTRPETPTVNGLTDGNSQFPERVNVGLHDFNPNQTVGTPTGMNPNGGANPFRMTRDQIVTCSNNHDYQGEQLATNSGFMDKFPQQNVSTPPQPGCATDGSTVMGYFDGNTVTAMWGWAQRFSMSDNSWGTTYGPSTPGALNLVSGQTAGAVVHQFTGARDSHGRLTDTIVATTIPDTFFVGKANPVVMADQLGAGGKVALQTGTLVTDLDPYLDDCGNDKGGTATANPGTVEMTGKNVGDLLNAKGVSWGWFAGGFRTAAKPNPVTTDPANPMGGVNNDPFGVPSFGGDVNGGDGQATHTNDGGVFTPAVCNAKHVLHPDATRTFDGNTQILHPVRGDYNPHHSPFQYYASTRNPHHLPPKNVAEIGHNGQANHQYDLLDFYAALQAGNLPAVSFIKAINRDDGHPGGESDPLAEQRFLVQTINQLEKSPEWESTAVFIAWDDSDGWYDHAAPPLVNPSAAPGFDGVSSANGGNCGTPKSDALQGRCGFGPRLVLNMVSPWSKVNYVDHTLTDQSSLLRFIEDNWGLDYIDGPARRDATNGRRQPSFALAPQKQSFDVVTGSFDNMFDDEPHMQRFILDPVTGLPLRDERGGY